RLPRSWTCSPPGRATTTAPASRTDWASTRAQSRSSRRSSVKVGYRSCGRSEPREGAPVSSDGAGRVSEFEQVRLLAAVIETIVPGDTSPSALETGGLDFLQSLLDGEGRAWRGQVEKVLEAVVATEPGFIGLDALARLAALDRLA